MPDESIEEVIGKSITKVARELGQPNCQPVTKAEGAALVEAIRKKAMPAVIAELRARIDAAEAEAIRKRTISPEQRQAVAKAIVALGDRIPMIEKDQATRHIRLNGHSTWKGII